VGGFLGALLDPVWFVQEQIPQKVPVIVNENSLVVAWQLGNLYLLMAFLGVGILSTTSELKVVKAYLFALWLGDVGHVAFTCWGLGKERLMAPAEWNAVTMGNVTFTVSEQGPTSGRRAIETEILQLFLFAMRSAYFLGAFGPPRSAVSASKKRS
jgi:hypothetical protein